MAGLRPRELRGVSQGYGWVSPIKTCKYENAKQYYIVTLLQLDDNENQNLAIVLHSTELPEDVIKMAKDIKPITEIKQNGKDFVVTSKTPGKTVTNSFTIGKEADITTMDGKKLKVPMCFKCAFFFKHYLCLPESI